MGNPTVLLADCHTRAGLAVLRSLSRRGLNLVVLSPQLRSVVGHSRWADQYYLVPAPVDDPTGFVNTVLLRAREHGADLVMPISDGALFLLNEVREALPQGCKLAAASSRAVSNVLNKEENLRLARRVGVPCVRQFPLVNANGIAQCVDELGLPLVVKNPAPEVSVKDGGLPFRMRFPSTIKALEQVFRETEKASVRPLYQEYVSGRTLNVAAFAKDGRVHALHQYISHRRSDHAGIFREVVPLRADLEKFACDLLAELRWDGLAHIGFIVDGDRVWYMETNGRFWCSVQGSIHAGWDIPYWQYQFFASGELPVVQPIQLGTLSCHRGADLSALLQYLHGGRSPTFHTDPGRGWAVRQYLTSFRPGVRADVFDWRDPWPGFYEHGSVLKAYLQARTARFRGSSPSVSA